MVDQGWGRKMGVGGGEVDTADKSWGRKMERRGWGGGRWRY